MPCGTLREPYGPPCACLRDPGLRKRQDRRQDSVVEIKAFRRSGQAAGSAIMGHDLPTVIKLPCILAPVDQKRVATGTMAPHQPPLALESWQAAGRFAILPTVR